MPASAQVSLCSLRGRAVPWLPLLVYVVYICAVCGINTLIADGVKVRTRETMPTYAHFRANILIHRRL